jgi:hypothetical protein
MRTFTILVLLILVSLKAVSQENDIQIPINTEFKDGLIVFTLPTPYSSPEYRPVAVPRFVTTQRTMKVYPDSPTKDVLLKVLHQRISIPQDEANRTESVDYLKNIALYIYLSNNDVTLIPQLARTTLTGWSKANISFKEELKLVTDYLRMADAFITRE